MAASLARIHAPQLSGSDLIAMLDTMFRDGGSIDFPNASIYYDEDWQEIEIRGNERVEQEVSVRTPSFIYKRYINGKWEKSAHCSLAEALRELEPK